MNVFKWEFIKCVRRIWLAVAAMGISIAIIGLLLWLRVSNETVLYNMLIVLEAPFIIGGVYLIVIYPVLNVIQDLRGKTALLERLHGCSYYYVLAVKLLINVVVVLLGSGLLLLAMNLMRRIEVQGISFLKITLNVPFLKLWLFTAVLFPALTAFSWLFAPFSHSSRPGILRFVGLTMIVPSFLSSGVSITVQCGVAALAYAASGFLYDKKYNVEI